MKQRRRSDENLSPDRKPAAVLARQCERALVAAARSTRVSTRKQIHRSAREFIRRHARNRAYLAWVMKRVAANAALAVALLGLARSAAWAAAPVFDPFPSDPAPFGGTVLGGTASPSVADLDNDGDLDLLVGSVFSPTIRYFENSGSATLPVYVERVGFANPVLNVPGPVSAIADLNGDGKLDIVTASSSGSFVYYVNIGTPVSPGFVAAATSPFGPQTVGAYATPQLGDFDGDGDFDLISGNLDGGLFYFENSGTATAPAFVPRVGAANPLNAFAGSAATLSNVTAPAPGDFDGDGDLDIAIGQGAEGLRYLENTGSAVTPAFREHLQAANPFRGEPGLNGNGRHRLSVADLDADGDLDIVRGDYGGRVTRLMNQFGQFVVSEDMDPSPLLFGSDFAVAGADFDGDGDVELFGQNCEFADNTGSAINPAFALSSLPGLACSNSPSAPLAVDVESDGDFDIVQKLSIHLNTGTPTNPAFVAAGPIPLPGILPNTDVRGVSFGDLDGDGDGDVVSFEFSFAPPAFQVFSRYFERVGPPSSFTLQEVTGPGNPLPAGLVATLAGDVDGDGDIDGGLAQLAGGGPSLVSAGYAENTGTPTSPAFEQRTGDRDPFFVACPSSPSSTCDVRRIALADVDGDGDLDSFGTDPSFFPPLLDGYFAENSIIRPSPRFNGPIAPVSGTLDAGSFSSLGAGDLDGDGDPDVVASESFASGALRFYQNIGSATAPRLVERFAADNPFTGLNAGWTPILAMGDIDSDGDLDLFSGEAYGAPLHYFENTGTSTVPAFVERVGAANPANNVAVSRSAPALGDLDRDGDLDLVIGSNPGNFRYFRNVGSASVPAFTEITGTANPLNGLVAGVGFISNPALGDVDLDGDLDLLSGDETTGGFHYFENTGTATAPAFVARTGPDNPADGKSVGLNSTPALVDLDGDRELDLVSGDRDGQVETFFLPEPSRGTLLTAGIALLGWLRRKRG